MNEVFILRLTNAYWAYSNLAFATKELAEQYRDKLYSQGVSALDIISLKFIQQ